MRVFLTERWCVSELPVTLTGALLFIWSQQIISFWTKKRPEDGLKTCF